MDRRIIRGARFKKYASDPRVTLIQNVYNQRSEFAAYEALKTDTEYLSFLFADDVYKPERIEIGLKAFRDQPDLDAVFSNVNGINEHGKSIHGKPWAVFDGDISLMSRHDHLRHFLFRGNCLHPCAMLVKTKTYIEQGGFKPYFHHIGDMIFFTRLLAHGKVKFLKDKLQQITVWLNGRNESAKIVKNPPNSLAYERVMFFEEFVSPAMMEQYTDIFEGKNKKGIVLKSQAERLWYIGHKILSFNNSFDARLFSFRCLYKAAEIADAVFYQNVAMFTGQTVPQHLAALGSDAVGILSSDIGQIHVPNLERRSFKGMAKRTIKAIPFSVPVYRYLKRKLRGQGQTTGDCGCYQARAMNLQQSSFKGKAKRAIKAIPFSVPVYRYLKRKLRGQGQTTRDCGCYQARAMNLDQRSFKGDAKRVIKAIPFSVPVYQYLERKLRERGLTFLSVKNTDDFVYTCNNLERGVRFSLEGVRCCSASTFQSPVFITAEEMKQGNITHELIVKRKTELFNAINAKKEEAGDCLKCSLLIKKPLKDVSFEYLGGGGMCSGFNIAHYSTCNLRCTYCDYNKRHLFVPPQYNNIIEYIEEFRKKGNIIPGAWINYNGGEPTLLSNYEEILNYLIDNNIGIIGLYTNGVKYSEVIYNALKKNQIKLITSLDSGTAATFKRIKGADVYDKVVSNLRKYQSSGTKMLFIKYVICEHNMNDDDLYGFVKLIEEINPGDVGLMPDFPYGDRQIPDEMVQFGAKLFFELNNIRTGPIHILSDHAPSDQKFIKYSKDIRDVYREIYSNRSRCKAA